MTGAMFLTREECPACLSKKSGRVLALSYLKPPVRDYLQDFYDNQGSIEWEYLRDADFVLDECPECGLVFQRHIPNGPMMDLLYGKWIDPKRACGRITEHPLEYYERLAREVTALIKFFNCPPGRLTLLDFGMGWGQWCRVAMAYGCSACGMELSEDRIKQAERYGIKVVNWD